MAKCPNCGLKFDDEPQDNYDNDFWTNCPKCEDRAEMHRQEIQEKRHPELYENQESKESDEA